MSVGPGPEQVEAALRGWPLRDFPPLPGRRNHLAAGVLVPLAWDGDAPGPTCLLGLRAPNLRLHAGEVVFPGGRPEPGDADLWATAAREAAEEMGIAGARPLGRLSAVPLYTSDYRLFPFVAEVSCQGLAPDGDELVAILRQPLDELLRRPRFDALPWTWEGNEHLSPVFDVGGHVLYGGTAEVLLELLRALVPVLDRPLPPLEPGRFTWAELLPSGR